MARKNRDTKYTTRPHHWIENNKLEIPPLCGWSWFSCKYCGVITQFPTTFEAAISFTNKKKVSTNRLEAHNSVDLWGI